MRKLIFKLEEKKLSVLKNSGCPLTKFLHRRKVACFYDIQYPYVVVIKVLSRILRVYGVTMMCIGRPVNQLTANSVKAILVLH